MRGASSGFPTVPGESAAPNRRSPPEFIGRGAAEVGAGAGSASMSSPERCFMAPLSVARSCRATGWRTQEPPGLLIYYLRPSFTSPLEPTSTGSGAKFDPNEHVRSTHGLSAGSGERWCHRERTECTAASRPDGQAAIVTGVGSGLGRATAVALAEAGADTAVLARAKGQAHDAAHEIEATNGRRVRLDTRGSGPRTSRPTVITPCGRDRPCIMSSARAPRHTATESGGTMGEEFATIRVAAVLASPVFADREAPVSTACRLFGGDGANGARSAVFPKTWLPGYPVWLDAAPGGGGAVRLGGGEHAHDQRDARHRHRKDDRRRGAGHVQGDHDRVHVRTVPRMPSASGPRFPTVGRKTRTVG